MAINGIESEYVGLKDLSRSDLIEALYTQTPHSLSRVCLQLIEVGVEVSKDTHDIVEDIAYALTFFGEKAKMGDKKAIDTLGRFSFHIAGTGRLRYNFATRLATNTTYFDTTLQDTYQKVILSLHEKPKFVPFIKKTEEDIATTLDTPANEHY